jgi:cobalamin biosynthesis Co2+ chelatase CbiK
VKGVLTQVHRNAVIVSEPRIDKISLLEEGVFKTIRWIPPENSIIEVASAYENIIVISLLNINGSIITVLRVDIDYEKKQIEIIKIAESLLDSQPCFIKCISPR